MSKDIFNPPDMMKPAGYSHVAKVNRGAIVYLSGQVPSDASGKLIGEGDFEAQVEQIFRNLKLAVEAAGGTMADIVKLNYYLAAASRGEGGRIRNDVAITVASAVDRRDRLDLDQPLRRDQRFDDDRRCSAATVTPIVNSTAPRCRRRSVVS